MGTSSIFCGKSIANGNRKLLPSLCILDAISILVFVLFILNRVQKYEQVGTVDLVEITQPGYVLGLVDRYDHVLDSVSSR